MALTVHTYWFVNDWFGINRSHGKLLLRNWSDCKRLTTKLYLLGWSLDNMWTWQQQLICS